AAGRTPPRRPARPAPARPRPGRTRARGAPRRARSSKARRTRRAAAPSPAGSRRALACVSRAWRQLIAGAAPPAASVAVVCIGRPAREAPAERGHHLVVVRVGGDVGAGDVHLQVLAPEVPVVEGSAVKPAAEATTEKRIVWTPGGAVRGETYGP